MMQFQPYGDAAVNLHFSKEVSLSLHQQIMSWTDRIEQANIPGILSCIPAYQTITVLYDPTRITYQNIVAHLKKLPESKTIKRATKTIDIPVCYGGDMGPDLAAMAVENNCSISSLIEQHSSQSYTVHMLGFLPGFCYLSKMEQIHGQRKATPRIKVPAGSVGIAGSQTGIYPVDSPGGWQLIGRTPKRIYRPSEANPFLIAPGDRIRFTPISEARFHQLNQYND